MFAPALSQETPTPSGTPTLFTQAEQDWLKAHPVLRLSGDPDWLPLEAFTPEGEYRGIVPDYLKVIEKHSGLRFTIVPTKEWDETLAMAQSHEVDIISAMESVERSRYLNFTKIYFEMPIVIVTRKNHPSVSDPSALAGLKVAIPKGYGFVTELRQRHPNLNYIEVPTITEGLRGVSFGKYDAVIESVAPANYKIVELGLNNLRINGDTSQLMRLGLGVRKDWPELVTILNKVMDDIPASDLNAIKRKWMAPPEASKAPQTLDLTEEERAWLAAHPVVKVAVDPAYPPIEFQDEQGHHRGITGDILELVSQRLGIKFEPAKGMTWNELIEGIKNKDL
ncbi:MAG: transporter substrate-binding domain-containing protein, partial [Desulfuromonadales bacterium]|nr:transporter substrate-binding domain-containing protein [Desulfuromonadales bacterium]